MRYLTIFLLATSLAAQTAPKVRPHYQPQQPQWAYMDPHGIWDVPQTLVDSWWMELTGHLVWKHYKVSYLPLRGNLYDKVENLSHPLTGFDRERGFYTDFTHDPKNLILTPTSFEFDAVAGDSIAWKVWSK